MAHARHSRRKGRTDSALVRLSRFSSVAARNDVDELVHATPTEITFLTLRNWAAFSILQHIHIESLPSDIPTLHHIGKMAAAEHQPQQPNFEALATHFRDASEELRLCANIPALDGGNRLLDTLLQVQRQMVDMQRQMTDMQRETRTQ